MKKEIIPTLFAILVFVAIILIYKYSGMAESFENSAF